MPRTRATRSVNLTKKESEMLQGFTLIFVGDFGPKLPEATLTKYVDLRGGKVSQKFDDSVTHLVCTDAEFKKRVSKRNAKSAS